MFWSVYVQTEDQLTEFWSLAEDKGVGPELADGSVVEALVADGASEAAGAQDVQHVEPGPDRSDDAEDRTMRQDQQLECINTTSSDVRTGPTADPPSRNQNQPDLWLILM